MLTSSVCQSLTMVLTTGKVIVLLTLLLCQFSLQEDVEEETVEGVEGASDTAETEAGEEQNGALDEMLDEIVDEGKEDDVRPVYEDVVDDEPIENIVATGGEEVGKEDGAEEKEAVQENTKEGVEEAVPEKTEEDVEEAREVESEVSKALDQMSIDEVFKMGKEVVKPVTEIIVDDVPLENVVVSTGGGEAKSDAVIEEKKVVQQEEKVVEGVKAVEDAKAGSIVGGSAGVEGGLAIGGGVAGVGASVNAAVSSGTSGETKEVKVVEEVQVTSSVAKSDTKESSGTAGGAKIGLFELPLPYKFIFKMEYPIKSLIGFALPKIKSQVMDLVRSKLINLGFPIPEVAKPVVPPPPPPPPPSPIASHPVVLPHFFKRLGAWSVQNFQKYPPFWSGKMFALPYFKRFQWADGVLKEELVDHGIAAGIDEALDASKKVEIIHLDFHCEFQPC